MTCLQSMALFFCACWLFTNVVVLNLIIAVVLERFRLRDHVKLAVQRREVLKAVRTTKASAVLLPSSLPEHVKHHSSSWHP